MAKILVVSDVHGRTKRLRWLLENEPADALFFLGDGLYDLDRALLQCAAPPRYPIYRVRGNCDSGFPDPSEGLVPFGGVLFFYTHGHHYGVKSGYEDLADSAGRRGADVALFGHTHARALERGLGVTATVFNPGSLGDSSSYGVIETDDEGGCTFRWKRGPLL